jgi:ATP-dependent helicase/nuclease subunit A
MPRLTDDQRQAVESIDQHVLVSAGAGCGKTLVLVERYLEVLRKNDDATINDIIAVTFTRKAAEEMRSRLKARLREIAAEAGGSAPVQERGRWARLLADVDRARIGTIHSLCESILKSHPAEAGVDPQFEVLDDLTRAEMLEQSVDEALQKLLQEPEIGSTLLLEYPIDRLKEWVIAQLASIPQYKEARSVLGGDGLEKLTEAAQSAIALVRDSQLIALAESAELRAAHEFLSANPFSDPKSALEDTRQAVLSSLDTFARCAKQADADKMSEAIRALAEIPSPRTAGGAKGQTMRDAIKAARELAGAFAKNCPLGLTDEDERAFTMLRSLLRLIDTSLHHFEAAKRQSQKLDYNDLISKTHALVTAPGSPARKQISAGVRAVLVDEFQDTNSRQAELLSCLCGENARLFLIGDDKQSIYKFQGADVSTFNQWKERIRNQTHGLAGDAQLMDLSFSFRSHPSIVDFVNRFFQFHFQSSSLTRGAHRASHQALTPARKEDHLHERVEVVQFDPSAGEGEKRDSERARLMEARAIAAWILEKIKAEAGVFCPKTEKVRPVEFGDFAILVQQNSDFALLESALADANIPFVTFAGGGFLGRQEILDIENMLRWLANPLDDHALLGVLRSPFFSINDGVLHKLFIEESGSLWQRVNTASKKEEFVVLQRPARILKQLLQDSKSLQVADIVREVITITSFDVTLLVLPNGRQKSRNAWKLADFAVQYNQLGLTEFVQALEAMRELGAGKQTDAPLSSENSVKLMTIHKSKGLEFPIVILPVLGRKVHLTSPKLLVHREFGIALDTSRSMGDPRPAYFLAAASLNAEMDAQEKKRLLYVAMTRARDWLVMFVEQNARNDVSFRQWLREGLGLGEGEDDRPGAPLRSGEHYALRYVDEDILTAWEKEGAAVAGRTVSDEELQSLSEEIGFDLLESLASVEQTASSSVPWAATLRVTALPESEPHATVVGNLFHAAMQRLALTGKLDDEPSLDVLASEELAIVDSQLRKKLVHECSRMLEIYRGSRLADLLPKTRRFLSEVGYTTFGEDGQVQDKRPDLIFQDDNQRWHVVDFKTDKLTPEDVPEKVNEHSAQVLEYVNDFERLTGFRASGWLYFAELGLLVEIKTPGFDVGNKGQLKLPFAAR